MTSSTIYILSDHHNMPFHFLSYTTKVFVKMMLVGDWVPENKHVDINLTAMSVLCNLEGPILPHARSFISASKVGPTLFSRELPNSNLQFIFSLANNHIMDYGLEGLETTLNLIAQKKFQACGAGKNVFDARRPVIIREGDVKVGIIACCEPQFGVARRNQAGVAEFGSWIYLAIRDLRKMVNGVVVSIHAAVEDSPWPSPYIRDFYCSLIDSGATIVHGHHAHVPQGFEEYGGGVIFYGMGNFVVDPDKWCNYPNGMWSLAAEVDFSSHPICWRLLTFETRYQSDSDTIVIEESNSEEQENHRHYLEKCNRPFENIELYDGLWHEVALRSYYHHGARYMRFSTSRQKGRRIQAKAGLSMLKGALLNRSTPSPHYSQYDYLLWYHMISCESHRQMLATALGIISGEIEDLRNEATRCLADEMMPWSVGIASI